MKAESDLNEAVNAKVASEKKAKEFEDKARDA